MGLNALGGEKFAALAILNLKIGGINCLQRGTIEGVKPDPHLMAVIDDAAAEPVLSAERGLRPASAGAPRR